MSKKRQYYGICKPQAWEPNREYLEGMIMFGSTEFDVRGRLAECRTQFKYGGNEEAVWKPVRTIFNAFADAEIARARLDDTPPDSPDITAERAAAYTDALARLEEVREESGMYGQAAEWFEISRTIDDLEIDYSRLKWLDQPSQPKHSLPKPCQPKPKPKPRPGGFGFGGRRTRRRKGTMRHQRKKRSSTYKTYRKSSA